jgi:hypothetical protein
VLNLAEYGRIRILADRLGVESIDREGRLVVIRFRPQAKLDPVRMFKIIAEWPGASVVPPVSVKLDLEAPLEKPKPAVKAPPPPPAKPASPWIRDGKRLRQAAPDQGSWWTARATSGEVKAGFTKEEIMRKPESDPRAEGGMFARLEGLLRALTS